jgi:GrpB-like predicted nucleotidyltransferase (UPF0157 family)
MKKEEIKLVHYTTEWTAKYTLEKHKLVGVLKPYAYEIEHIGSTSVIHMTAKPIIDIAVKLETLNLVPQLIIPLSRLSYIYRGEYGLEGRHFFEKGAPRQFHLHIVDNNTDHWNRWLKFRQVLRQNKQVREEYTNLKTKLAQEYHHQREKYTQGKSDFINSIISIY